MKTFAPVFVGDALDVLGRMVFDTFTPEYQGELIGIANELNVDVLLLSIAQIAYELSDCTSILAKESGTGTIHHVRNLDFGQGLGFTNLLRNLTAHVEFQRGGKVLYEAGVFGGFIGILTGMKPNAFSVSVDTRFVRGNPLTAYFDMLKEALQKNDTKNIYDVGHMVRMALETQSTFAGAVKTLSTTPMLGNVYYIIGGLKAPGIIIRLVLILRSHTFRWCNYCAKCDWCSTCKNDFVSFFSI